MIERVVRSEGAGRIHGPGDGRAAARASCAREEGVGAVDPVAGGEALVVIDVGSWVNALAVFADPATGRAANSLW